MADTALMAESTLTSTPTKARKVRSEVLSGLERRRRWSVEEKLRILGQCALPGAIPSLVCREHGIGTGQLYTWRKQFRNGELTAAQLSMLLEGIDWRMPLRSWAPEAAC